MVRITANIQEAASWIDNFQQEMLPYAISSTLTKTVRDIQKAARIDIASRFPGRGGMRWMLYGGGARGRGLTIEPATKTKLWARVYFDIAQSAIFYLHEVGGTKTPRQAHFAVPMPELIRPGRRIERSLMPKVLLGSNMPGMGVMAQAWMAKKAEAKSAGKRLRRGKVLGNLGQGFIVKGKDDKLFIAVRKQGKLNILWWLAPLTHVKRRLHFEDIARRTAELWIRPNFIVSMQEVSTAFKNRQRIIAKETATAYE